MAQAGTFAALRGRWAVAEVAGLPAPGRWGHSAVAVDGQMLIFGGCFGGQHLTNLVAYNRTTRSWSQIRTTGVQQGPRDSHGACVVGRQLVVVGGTDGRAKLADVDVLSLDTLEWSAPLCSGTPPQPRESHVTCATPDGRIVVAFGSGEGAAAYLADGVFVLDSATWTWSAPALPSEMPPARDSAAACMLGRHMVLFGGDQGAKYLEDTWLLDTATFAWEQVDTPGGCPSPRAGQSAVAISQDVALFFGGVGDGSAPGETVYHADVWAFSLPSRTWHPVPIAGPAPPGRFSHAACLLDGDMFVHGGCAKDELPLDEMAVLRLSPADEPPGPADAAAGERSSPGLLHMPSPVRGTPPPSPGLLLSSIPPHPSELLPALDGPPPAAAPPASYNSEPEGAPLFHPPLQVVPGSAREPGHSLERPSSAPAMSLGLERPRAARRVGPAVILEGRPISGNTASPDSSLSLSAGAAAMETGQKRGRGSRTGKSVLSFLDSLPPAPDPESPPRRRRGRARPPSSPSALSGGGGASFGGGLGRSLSGGGDADAGPFSSSKDQKLAMQRFLQQRKAEKDAQRARAAEQAAAAEHPHDLRPDLAPLHVPARRMVHYGAAYPGSAPAAAAAEFSTGPFTQLLLHEGTPVDARIEGGAHDAHDGTLAGAMLGAAVHGVVDGTLDMGYRITAQAGGHVFRGCLFANLPPGPAKETGAAAMYAPGAHAPVPLPGWPVAPQPRPIMGDLDNPVAGRRVASVGGRFYPPAQPRAGAYFSRVGVGGGGDAKARGGGEPMSVEAVEAMEGIIQDLQSTHQARQGKSQPRQGGGQLGGQQWPPK